MPTGDLSLLDAAKNMPESFARGVIQTYASAYHPFVVMPMANPAAGIMKWKIETALAYTTSAAGYRNLDAEYTSTKTPVEEFVSNYKIPGGRVKMDRLVSEYAPEEATIQERGQIKAQAKIVTKDLFEGAGGTYIRGIDDVITKVPLWQGQSVDMGTISTGAVLSMDKMDEFLDLVNVIPGRTYIYCNQTPARMLTKLARGFGSTDFLGQNIQYRSEEFGMIQHTYQGIPIVPMKDGKGVDILSNTTGDGSSTQLYAITYGEENFTGFQLHSQRVIQDMEEISVMKAFDLEWPMNTAAKSIKCIARMRYVKNAVA